MFLARAQSCDSRITLRVQVLRISRVDLYCLVIAPCLFQNVTSQAPRAYSALSNFLATGLPHAIGAAGVISSL
jgi:hypothetical protein